MCLIEHYRSKQCGAWLELDMDYTAESVVYCLNECDCICRTIVPVRSALLYADYLNSVSLKRT